MATTPTRRFVVAEFDTERHCAEFPTLWTQTFASKEAAIAAIQECLEEQSFGEASDDFSVEEDDAGTVVIPFAWGIGFRVAAIDIEA